jgi:precorrin-6Y C5,15-methyltransferase (decarboxylating)
VFGLCEDARGAIEGAGLVVGSKRQLALVQPLLTHDKLLLPTQLPDIVPEILVRRGTAVCVLATGDPFFFGIGATLAPYLSRGEFTCYPAPSSISIAAARLAWPLQDTDIVSLHGRKLTSVIRYLQPGRSILALSLDRETPGQLAALLDELGFGTSQMHVLEALGGPLERIRSSTANSFDLDAIDDLNIVAIEVATASNAFSIPSRGSLPDFIFEHDGQLTKQDMRALTLSALSPRPGERLWDVGAGAGSICIEWMLCHPSCQAIAIEKSPERCLRIKRNAARLGVPTLEIVEACAPQGLAGLREPDAIFIGGGASKVNVFENCWRALRPGGRLVINAVSLESEAALIELSRSFGGELCRVSIDRAIPLGSLSVWKPAIPVVQWRVCKL